jgi:hypothetical protein
MMNREKNSVCVNMLHRWHNVEFSAKNLDRD